MKIRYVSDLHLELDAKFKLENEQNDDVLVLAGDICSLTEYSDQNDWSDKSISARLRDIFSNFIDDCCSKFKHVIMVLGNHDYWGLTLHISNPHYFLSENPFADKSPIVYSHIASKNKNLRILSGGSVEIDGVMFIGATLWTDLNDGDPITTIQAPLMTHDFKKICVKEGYGTTYIKPGQWIWLNKRDKFLMEHAFKGAKPDQKIVVVTHYSPFQESINPMYRGSPANPAFHNSNLVNKQTNEIIEPFSRANVWIHGHTHSNLNYIKDNTNVLCNPRGYMMRSHKGIIPENPQFNPNQIVEV